MLIQTIARVFHDDSTPRLLGKGLLGMVSAGGAATLSFLQTAEMWMRLASLGVGIVVGLLTGVSVWMGLRIKWRKLNGRR